MEHAPIFTDWTADTTRGFGREVLHLRHALARSELFADEALARLIEKAPRHLYHVCTMSRVGDRSGAWRDGDIDGLSGRDVLEAVKRGHLWVHVQKLPEIDPAYGALLDRIFAEIEGRVPGLETFKRQMTFLISSPKAQVYYHCDVPGQSLWQLRGTKRVYVYPNVPPFLEPEAMERIVLGVQREDVHFEPWFDEHATIIDLAPGEMLTWPLNAPHRIENHDVVNVSLTTEHWTREIRGSYAVHYANGLLRRNLGIRTLGRETNGFALYGKMGLAALHKYGRPKRKGGVRAFEVDFRVDPQAELGYRDIPAYEIAK